MSKINFGGKLTDVAYKWYRKKALFFSAMVFLLLGLGVGIVLALLFYKQINPSLHLLLAGLYLIGILLIALIVVFDFRKHIGPELPNKITISSEGIEIDRENYYRIRKYTDVRKIVDKGEFYVICFYYPWNDRCLCQKDLITQGTIEEFEQIFEDYIVRKPLKNPN